MRVVELTARLARIKHELSFGEAAVAAGLKGSSRAGWRCPNCHLDHALIERPDHQGARCKDCGRGYDTPGVVMAARGLSALQAALFLERVIAERAAPNDKAPGLFGEG